MDSTPQHGVRLTLAYDGTEYSGFQRQTNARTVQGELDRAIERITQQPVTSRGCSRTDAGVHAEGQIVAFESARELSSYRWLMALNRYLPSDVAVQAAESCTPGYDPRFDAFDKTYRYFFYLGLPRHPLWDRRVWHLARDVSSALGRERRSGVQTPPLDLPTMQLAAANMEGTHDFAAFRAADDTREHTERTLYAVRLIPDFRAQPGLLALEVHGNAFMKNMVRVLAGTLVSVGRGQLTPDQVRTLLEPGQSRNQYAQTAPAKGLTLIHVTLGRLAQSNR